MDFLLHRMLPDSCSDAMKIKRKSSRFFVEEGHLFIRGFTHMPLHCIAGFEVTKVLHEVYVGDCS